MARKMPARFTSGPKKGQFKPRGAKKRRRRRNPASSSTSAAARSSTVKKSNPSRRRRRAAAPARRRRRRNPGTPSLVRQLVGGVKDAAAIVGGEAAARIIPTMAKLPKEGPVGLAVQAAAGVAAGYLANRFMGREVGRLVLAGALSAPLKTALVAARVPVLSPALSPATQAEALGAYKSLRAYVLPSGDQVGTRRPGMGSYVSASRGDDLGLPIQ